MLEPFRKASTRQWQVLGVDRVYPRGEQPIRARVVEAGAYDDLLLEQTRKAAELEADKKDLVRMVKNLKKEVKVWKNGNKPAKSLVEDSGEFACWT